jgi:hypothetical protein
VPLHQKPAAAETEAQHCARLPIQQQRALAGLLLVAWLAAWLVLALLAAAAAAAGGAAALAAPAALLLPALLLPPQLLEALLQKIFRHTEKATTIGGDTLVDGCCSKDLQFCSLCTTLLLKTKAAHNSMYILTMQPAAHARKAVNSCRY